MLPGLSTPRFKAKALNAGGTWLDASPRTLVRIASLLTARLDDPGVGLNVVATLSAVPSKLGATPADSARPRLGRRMAPTRWIDFSAGRMRRPHARMPLARPPFSREPLALGYLGRCHEVQHTVPAPDRSGKSLGGITGVLAVAVGSPHSAARWTNRIW